MRTECARRTRSSPPFAVVLFSTLLDIMAFWGIFARHWRKVGAVLWRFGNRNGSLCVGMVPLLFGLCGCTSLPEYIHNGFKVGPNFKTPPAPVAEEWIDAACLRPGHDTDDLRRWWTVFNDPILDQLICIAYKQNLTLREAGFRILEARDSRAIAVGNLFPQTQQAQGSITRQTLSRAAANAANVHQRSFPNYQFGFNLAWELDFWGRYRRAVESASATLDASIHDYDEILVTLLGDVATAYVQMRTTEQRIHVAEKNIKLQKSTVKYVKERFDVGAVNGVGLYQAESLQYQTEAAIHELKISLRVFNNQLCILLGIPPEELRNKIGDMPPLPELPGVDKKDAKPNKLPQPCEAGEAGRLPRYDANIRIPEPPDPETTPMAFGIPADLLRRRPEVRRAERLAAAQSAQIGIAESDFYPHISIAGNMQLSAAQFRKVFTPQAFAGTFGPTFQWNILSYGRILNNVRLQDARLGELITAYQQTVLTAQQEVENGLVTFFQAQQRYKKQKLSVDAAEKAEKSVLDQFNAGKVDIAQLILFEQNLVQQQDTLAVAAGERAMGLIMVYQALGGGWEIRLTGCNPQEGPIDSVRAQGAAAVVEQIGPPLKLPNAPQK